MATYFVEAVKINNQQVEADPFTSSVNGVPLSLAVVRLADSDVARAIADSEPYYVQPTLKHAEQ